MIVAISLWKFICGLNDEGVRLQNCGVGIAFTYTVAPNGPAFSISAQEQPTQLCAITTPPSVTLEGPKVRITLGVGFEPVTWCEATWNALSGLTYIDRMKSCWGTLS
jgi:hypothetical protein